MSAVSTGGGGQYGDHKMDKTINSRYIPNSRYPSNTDKNKVIYEIKNQGVKLGNRKVSKTVNKLDNIKLIILPRSRWSSNPVVRHWERAQYRQMHHRSLGHVLQKGDRESQ